MNKAQARTKAMEVLEETRDDLSQSGIELTGIEFDDFEFDEDFDSQVAKITSDVVVYDEDGYPSSDEYSEDDLLFKIGFSINGVITYYVDGFFTAFVDRENGKIVFRLLF